MIYLPDIHPYLGEALRIKRERLAKASNGAMGAMAVELQQFERLTASGALYLDLDWNGFQHALMRCAWTRIHFLRRVPPEERENDRYARVTRLEGFVDAVASRRNDLASRIADLSPKAWAESFEYEDDYCYARFLHGVVQGAAFDVQAATLERFAAVLNGEASPRYDVCVALLTGDGETFDDAFQSLIDDWDTDVAFRRTSIGRDEFAFATDRHLFIEGLALLMLAEQAELPTRDAYPYCPADARRAADHPLPENTYLQ